MERKKQIVITPEESKYIQKTFGVSNTTVWHALTYRRSNEIHRKIRKSAIERGGQQMHPHVLVHHVSESSRANQDHLYKRA